MNCQRKKRKRRKKRRLHTGYPRWYTTLGLLVIWGAYRHGPQPGMECRIYRRIPDARTVGILREAGSQNQFRWLSGIYITPIPISLIPRYKPIIYFLLKSRQFVFERLFLLDEFVFRRLILGKRKGIFKIGGHQFIELLVNTNNLNFYFLSKKFR